MASGEVNNVPESIAKREIAPTTATDAPVPATTKATGNKVGFKT